MDSEISFVEHLEELRRRIIISVVALIAGAVACLPFAPQILTALRSPASGLIDKLAFFSPQDAFVIYMRIGFMGGLILAFPVIAYQFWAFVSPAIEDRFKKNTVLLAFFCVCAFVSGCAFSYFILLPKALTFLLGIGSENLEPVISAANYVSFVTAIIVSCGLVFQMPVLSFLLTRTGLVNSGMLRKKFKYAVIIIFIAAAVITPTVDAFNMLILAVPMLLLYEISIWVSAIAGRCAPKGQQPEGYGRAG
ncbi:MAG: twin-arginine translocase subunit TatC [Candidatus Omnitrophica bacterium]|nr:twin-arginine translocase subunit TatC [Candidatus Omnitrophota bacterium]